MKFWLTKISFYDRFIFDGASQSSQHTKLIRKTDGFLFDINKRKRINCITRYYIIILNLMRSVINISLPEAMSKEVARGVKELRYASKSEFFRHLLREWLAERLLNTVKKGRAEYRAGKAKKLTDPKNLWK